jgi:D-tyrosyl-tRNA(Tyr) deacylase
MRAVVQRASSASVTINGEVVGELPKPGLVMLVGVTHPDDDDAAVRMARKVWELRILEGGQSCSDIGAPLLVISQFTVYADTRKGRRPSWAAAAPGAIAEPLIERLCEELRNLGAHVETGRFGAYMHVAMVNDGPVTVIVES